MGGVSHESESATVASTSGSGNFAPLSSAKEMPSPDKRCRPKPCLLATHSKLQQIVASKLMQDWSPQQISGWLKQHHPDDESMRVSHETIYRSLFIQARGALKTGVGPASAIAAADPPLNA
jgi:IS30 family transposase